MRSTLSNPIEAGVDTFSKLMGTFNQMEDSKQRRTLMAQQEADRKLKQEWDQKEHAENQRLWDRQHLIEHGEDMLGGMALAKKRLDETDKDSTFNVLDLPKEQQDAIIYAHGLHNTPSSDLGDLLDFSITAGKQAQGKKVQIPLDDRKSKSLTSALQISPEKLNTDDYGNKVEGKVVGATVDGTTPDMNMGLMVERNLKPGVYKHISNDKNEVYVAPGSNPQGMEQKGNINLNARPVVKNDNGTISTVLSSSFEIDGKEVLLPLVSDDGRIISAKEAQENYKKTGKHLGIFDTPANANAYAQELHNSSLWKKDIEYYSQGSHKDLLKMGEGGDPNSPYVIHPAQMIHSKLSLQKEFADMYDQLEAKTHPKEFAKRQDAVNKIRQENKAISEAYKTSGGDLAKFVETLLDKYPEITRKDAKEAFETYLKTKPKMTSKAGKEMTDRDELVKTYGEKSPEVETFDKKTAGSEAGANKTIYGPGGKTKEVFIDKGKDYTPPKGWSLKAPKESADDKPETKGEKNKQIARVVELTDRDGSLIKKIAQDEVRGGKVDADKAVDNARAKIKNITKGIKSGKQAVATLIKAGYDEQDAIEYVKANSEKKPKAK